MPFSCSPWKNCLYLLFLFPLLPFSFEHTVIKFSFLQFSWRVVKITNDFSIAVSNGQLPVLVDLWRVFDTAYSFFLKCVLSVQEISLCCSFFLTVLSGLHLKKLQRRRKRTMKINQRCQKPPWPNWRKARSRSWAHFPSWTSPDPSLPWRPTV